MQKYLFIQLSVVILCLSMFYRNELPQLTAEKQAIRIEDTPQLTVVELFTSQGCSSCPPADDLLAELIEKKQNIIALSFHVDYWNRLGWRDPFSDAAYSKRQHAYCAAMNLSSVYTPQMVLNGHYEFVGSDKKILEQNLAKASAEKMTVQVKNIKIDDSNNSLSVTYELEGDWKGKTVNVALVQKEATTKIGKGENGGRTLINHNIVRGLLSENAAAKGKAVFNTISDTYRIVVYVQDKSMKVVGAGMSK